MDASEKIIRGSIELNRMFMALRRTADGLRRDFGEVENLQQSLTGASGFVKKARERIEAMILRDLELVRPRAGVLTPGLSRDGDGRDEFVLALSGAENFVRGISHFAISLALRVNNETKIALVYSPIDDRLYYAEAEEGAYLFAPYHSQRLHVSLNETDGFGRSTGCPALDLAYVAAGKFDIARLPPLDYAEICAGELLVAEAGGKIAQEDGDLVATNGKIGVKSGE
jgi:myo-inositol-1(or 4)-monophosphatase